MSTEFIKVRLKAPECISPKAGYSQPEYVNIAAIRGAYYDDGEFVIDIYSSVAVHPDDVPMVVKALEERLVK